MFWFLKLGRWVVGLGRTVSPHYFDSAGRSYCEPICRVGYTRSRSFTVRHAHNLRVPVPILMFAFWLKQERRHFFETIAILPLFRKPARHSFLDDFYFILDRFDLSNKRMQLFPQHFSYLFYTNQSSFASMKFSNSKVTRVNMRDVKKKYSDIVHSVGIRKMSSRFKDYSKLNKR